MKHGHKNSPRNPIRRRSRQSRSVFTAALLFVLCASTSTAGASPSPPAQRAEGSALRNLVTAENSQPGLRAAFSEAWRWVPFKTNTGLPSNSVYDVLETPAGTVWAATNTGPAWYDGYRWTAMGPEQGAPADKPGSMARHGNDEVLMVARGRLYRGGRDGFVPLAIEVEGVDYQAIDVREAEAGNNFLRASRDAYSPFVLLHFDGDDFRVLSTIPRGASKVDSPSWSDGNGTLWLNTVSALERWRDGSWEKKLIAPPGEPLHVDRLVQSADGTGLAQIAYPPDYRGLWEWRDGGAPVHNANEPADLLESMAIAPSGDAVVFYRSGDIRFRENGHWSAIERAPAEIAGVLFAEFRDDGDLWVGTQHGLFLLRTSLQRWTNWKVPSPDVRNEVLEIVQAADGAIWLATGRGLAVHHVNGRVEWIDRIGETRLQEITGLTEDAEGGIWISSGSALSGAYRWDGSAWTHFGEAEGLLAPLVHKIRKDRSGRLWFLGMAKLVDEQTTVPQPGAFVLEDGMFVPWTPAEGLINGRVYDLAEGTDGSLWFATFGGLSRWRAGEWRHWTTDDGLRRDRIFTVEVDDANRTWFGDQQSGLGFIDENGAPQYLTVRDGLIHDGVQEVGLGLAGELWIATKGGLSCLHEGIWVNFDVTTGLSSPILWPLLPQAGRVLIGTSGNGVDILSLGEAVLPAPRVEFDPPHTDEGATLLRWHVYGHWGQLPPEAIETRYRIDAGEWSYWSTARETQYPGLRPGGHRFAVQTKGAFGNVDSNPSAITFDVPPPLYFRPTFYIPTGALLAVVVLLLIGRGRYTAAARQREGEYRRHLEERVDERTEALRQSEEQLRLLLETAHVIPWVADAETWEFTYVGPQAVSVLGHAIERWHEPDFWRSHIHPDDVDRALSYCAQQSRITDRYEFEYRMMAADGGIVWLQDLVAVVATEGQPTMLRGFMIDITARKQAEAERLTAETEALEQRERAAHLSRVNMLGEMATGIAHEVNQPLTAVSTYTQACRRMIEAGTIGQEEILDVLGRVSHEAVRAGDMIHGLKALVRKRSSEMSVCNANALVHDVISLAEVDARNLGIDIELDLADDLPDILADDVQVQQVILNLVRNAIEATETGTGRVKVTTSVVDTDMVEVEVVDNGNGAAEFDPEKVFQPFFSTKREGMGMGLSISRSIIDAHGGQIGCRPAETRGSVFYFRLPAEQDPTPAAG